MWMTIEGSYRRSSRGALKRIERNLPNATVVLVFIHYASGSIEAIRYCEEDPRFSLDDVRESALDENRRVMAREDAATSAAVMAANAMSNTDSVGYSSCMVDCG
jgi:hypothetical protein